jgi:DNA-binding HxlR family transcriptional regulator
MMPLAAQEPTCSDCARLYPLRILGRKWSYLVMRALHTPQSFSQIKRELKIITNHILTRELKQLQSEQLIVENDKYELTKEGMALMQAAEALVNWSVQHAGRAACPPGRKCSQCPNYPAVVERKSTAKA